MCVRSDVFTKKGVKQNMMVDLFIYLFDFGNVEEGLLLLSKKLLWFNRKVVPSGSEMFADGNA